MRSLDLLEEAKSLVFLHENRLCEDRLRLHETLLLLGARVRTQSKGTLDPLAVRLDLRQVLNCRITLLLSLRFCISQKPNLRRGLSHQGIELDDVLVVLVLLLLDLRGESCVIDKGLRLSFVRQGHLVLEVLLDLRHHLDNGVLRTSVVILAGEAGIRGLIFRDFEHRLLRRRLLDLEEDLVVRAVRRENRDSVLEQRNRRRVVTLRLRVCCALRCSVSRGLREHVLELLQLLPSAVLLLQHVRLRLLRAQDLRLELRDVVLLARLRILVEMLLLDAPIALYDVIVSLVLQLLDHIVDLADDVVEVTSRRRANSGGETSQPEVARAFRHLPEHQESLLPRVLLRLDLKEGHVHALTAEVVDDAVTRCRLEGVARGIAREDLESLVDAGKLLRAETAALIPLVALRLALVARRREDRLVGLLLLNRRRERRLGFRELLGLGRGLRLLVNDLPLQIAVALLQNCDVVLECLLELRFLAVRLLEVSSEGVVHVLQDPSNRGRLRGVRCLRLRLLLVVLLLRSFLQECDRLLQEALHDLHIFVRDRAELRRVEDCSAHLRGHLHEEEALVAARASTAQHLDGVVKRTERRLHVVLLGLVLTVLLRADTGLFLHRLIVLCDRALAVGHLAGEGGDLSLESQNLGGRRTDELLLINDSSRLA